MIDKSKHYRTRNGCEVRIYATDGLGVEPVHGAYYTEVGWLTTTWRKGGRYHSVASHEMDLIEVKPRIKRRVWLNVYECDTSYASKESADRFAGPSRIACIPIDIDCEYGEGLEEKGND